MIYTKAQRRRHIYDLQRFLRRIQQAQGDAVPLAPDGLFGVETANAVRIFQRQNGLPVTGTANFNTWTKIFQQYSQLTAQNRMPNAVWFFPTGADAQLSPASHGSAVLVLQLLLNAAAPHYTNLQPLCLTGEYDRATQNAISQMQEAFQMPSCGGVTNLSTWDALSLMYNNLFEQIPLLWQTAELAAQTPTQTP